MLIVNILIVGKKCLSSLIMKERKQVIDGAQEETLEAGNYPVEISLWLPQKQTNSTQFHTDSSFLSNAYLLGYALHSFSASMLVKPEC